MSLVPYVVEQTTAAGLVYHDFAVWQGISLALRPRSQQEGTHTRRHTNAVEK